MKMHTQRGFTLVEVMVAVSIVSFLSSIAFYAFGTARANAKGAVNTATIVATAQALEQNRADTGSNIGTQGQVIVENAGGGTAWNNTMQPLVTAGLLNRIPHSTDPSRPFWYVWFTNPTTGGSLVVLGYSNGNNSGGGYNQCDPFSAPNGGSNNPPSSPGDGAVSQNQSTTDRSDLLAQVGGASLGGDEAAPGQEVGGESVPVGEQGTSGSEGETGTPPPPACTSPKVLFGSLCLDFVPIIGKNANSAQQTGGQQQNYTPPVDEQSMIDGDGNPIDPCSPSVGTCTCIIS